MLAGEPYGANILIGAHSFVSHDCVPLDCNTITIGEAVQIVPGFTSTPPRIRAMWQRGELVGRPPGPS